MRRSPPQRVCFWGQQAGLRFQVSISVQFKGFSSRKGWKELGEGKVGEGGAAGEAQGQNPTL